MEDWNEVERISKIKKSLRDKFPLLGKKCRVKGRNKWEEGVIVLSTFDGEQPEYFVMYAEDDLEQACCLDVQIYNESSDKWEEIEDGAEMFPELSAEEIEFTKLNDADTVITNV